MQVPAFGLNRLDLRAPASFAASAGRAESLGWDYGFLPASPLLVQDPYVMLAAALAETERITLGPLLENPVTRHPAVIASSMATVERLAPGRTLLGLGVGDTAVRLLGLAPARVATLERATRTIRALLGGEPLPEHAVRLAHAARAPVWIAAQGPRTLEMAGRVADGVFIRVGTTEANLRAAIDAVRSGARESGRDPDEVRIGAVVHVVPCDHPERARTVGRSVAAGYYERSPRLFDGAGISWDGPPIEELQRQVFPDFHHARDLHAAGELVRFLPERAVEAFALHGSWDALRAQLQDLLALALPQPIETVVPHPVPAWPPGEGPEQDYMRTFAEEIIQRIR